MTVKVELFIETTSGDYFTLDDATKGKLDNVTYLLGGGKGRFGAATDITDQCHSVVTSRGRSRILDTIEAGSLIVELRNYDREFDPPFDGVAVSTYGEIRPGKRVRVSDGSTVVFDGVVEDWNYQWSADKSVTSELIAVDALGELARRLIHEDNEFPESQQAGDRIGAVLSLPGVSWPIGDRNIDTGVSYIKADEIPYGSNVLEYLQEVAQTDQGRLFADRTADLAYRDRHHAITASVAAAFGTGGIPVSAVGIAYGSEELATEVTVTREDGVPQTVTSDESVVVEFGHRDLILTGLLFDDDVRSRELAAWLLTRSEEPEPYVNSLTIALDRLSAGDRTTVVGLEIGDVVTFDWTPTGTGTAVSQELIVESVSYSSMVNGTDFVRLESTQITDRRRFILDDSTYGVLDDDRLAF